MTVLIIPCLTTVLPLSSLSLVRPPGIDDILTHDSARNACRVQLPLRALENSRACKEMGSLHKLYILYMKQQV